MTTQTFTHRDLFRLSHPTTVDPAFQALGNYILKDEVDDLTPEIVKGFVLAQAPGADLPALIREYRLSWEMLPTEAHNDRKVWDALLDSNLPLGALIRQLPRLTRLGMFEKLKADSRTAEVVKRLTDKAEVERARIHPLNVLEALKTYENGYSTRGESTWSPSADIVDALNDTYFLAFKNVVPTGKSFLIGLDTSGSMGLSSSAGSALTAREATAALSMVIAGTEANTHIVGFTSYVEGIGYRYGARSHPRVPQSGKPYTKSVTVLDNMLSPKRRLSDAIRDLSGLPFGGTDIAIPIMYALENDLRPEVFLILTDNETWAGSIQPFEALEKYRKVSGIDAKVIFLSTQATKNTLIDPKDKNSLDVAGFDSAAPQIVSSFARGDF